MFEIFEHTADLGLRIRTPQLNELFAEAGRALFSVIVENLDQVQARETKTIELEETELEYLFFDWLNTLLYLFDAKKLLFKDFDVQITQSVRESVHAPTNFGTQEKLQVASSAKQASWKLVATVRGEPVERGRHQMDHEVKAITYHGLKLEHGPQGWCAEVIVDI